MSARYSSISVISGMNNPAELNTTLKKLHRADAESIVAGRNITAGHTRGWCLEYGALIESIKNDEVYRESLELALGRTILAEHKLMNLFLIMKFGLEGITGDFLEFGSYKGGSAIFIANVARRLQLPGTVYAFDTFAGMPKTDEVLDLHKLGDFSDTNFDDLAAYVHELGLSNLKLVKGLFSDTAPQVLKSVNAIALAHIDCDIHDAVKYCLDAVQPKMHPKGGYITLDDPLHGSCLGALQAVEDWIIRENLRAEQAYPHLVYRYPTLSPG